MSMTEVRAPKYLRVGKTVRIVKHSGTPMEKLDPYIYEVKYDEEAKELYLEDVGPKFAMPKKLYGKINNYARRVVRRFGMVKSSMAAMFIGDKGAGKTQTIKLIANICLTKGYPVIIVKGGLGGTDSDFITFMNKFDKSVVMMDEFSKNFDMHKQSAVLDMFDGIFSDVERLFLIAENSTQSLSHLFIKRPGRVLYYWNYGKVSKEVIEGYIKDNLKNKRYAKKIVEAHASTPDFSTDYVKAIVDEINAFPDMDWDELIEGLNIEIGETITYEITKMKFKNAEGILINAPKIIGGTPETGFRVKANIIVESELSPQVFDLNRSNMTEYRDEVYSFERPWFFNGKQLELHIEVKKLQNARFNNNRGHGFMPQY